MNNLYFNKVFWFLNKQTNTPEIFGSVSAICAKTELKEAPPVRGFLFLYFLVPWNHKVTPMGGNLNGLFTMCIFINS